MEDKRKEYIKEWREKNKEILKEKSKKYRLENKEKIKEWRKVYWLKNKEEILEYQKNIYKKNKEKINEKNKKYRLENKEKVKESVRQWTLNNKEKVNLYRSKYYKNRKKIDYLFKLKKDISSSIYKSLKNKGYTKNTKTYQILGCSFEDFKEHIEKQFTEGMNWENHGQWHFDHIYPVSLAKDEEHLIKLNHYTNFQPLWAIDNLRKSNKIIDATT